MLQTLGQDDAVQIENEHPDNELYFEYRLRAEPTIRSLLWSYRRRIVLKPVADVDFEPVADIVGEFEEYDPLAVWLYRDPVNVWSSAKSTFDLPPSMLDEWIQKWRAGNESLLAAMEGPLRDRFLIVRYEDLISQREVFRDVCQFLEVEDRNNLFWREDRRTGRRGLLTEIQNVIGQRTSDVTARLDQVRHRVSVARESVPLVPPLLRPTWHREMINARVVPEVFAPRDVTIDLLESTEIELYHPLASMTGASTYVVSFWIRGKKKGHLRVQISRNKSPWENLGHFSHVLIGTEWSHVGFLFPTNEDIDSPRLHLTASAGVEQIEISRVTAGPLFCRLFELHCHRGLQARIERLIDHPGGIAVEMEPKPDARRDDIQLVLTQGWFEAGTTYRCWIWSRSPQTGRFGITLGLPTDPWNLISEYREIEVGPTESPVMLEFVPTQSGIARLYVEIPNELGRIEFLHVSIRPACISLGVIRTKEGADCRHEPVEDEAAVRLRPQGTTERNNNDVQWELQVGPGFQGVRYAFSFRARAEENRPFGAGLSDGDAPWTPIDLYFNHVASIQWQSYYFEIVLDRDWPCIRALFDIGTSAIPIELADVRFRPVADRLTPREIERLKKAAASLLPPS
jgi:hypothetical protein